MRIRDIIKDSLDALVARDLLPPYPARVRISLPPERAGAVWSNKQLTTAILASVDGTFRGDAVAWERAVWVVEDFRASAAARNGSAKWPLPRCCGPFNKVTVLHVYERVAAALQASGLTAATPPSNAYRGTFRLTEEKVPMTSLPVFYGHWLARQGGYPWDASVHFELLVEATVFSEYLSPGPGIDDEPYVFVSLGLSAPAISLALAFAREIRIQVGPPAVSAGSAQGAAAPRMLANQVAERWGLAPPFPLS